MHGTSGACVSGMSESSKSVIARMPAACQNAAETTDIERRQDAGETGHDHECCIWPQHSKRPPKR